MKISGNQTAVKEMMNLLDPSFVPPFMCRCFIDQGFVQSNTYAEDRGLGRTHWCECSEQDKWREDNFGSYYHVYEIEYDGQKIYKCKAINSPVHESGNLLTGCVK